jgi:hypothetical protein
MSTQLRNGMALGAYELCFVNLGRKIREHRMTKSMRLALSVYDDKLIDASQKEIPLFFENNDIVDFTDIISRNWISQILNYP